MSEKTTVVDLANVIAMANFIFGKCAGIEEVAYLMHQRAGTYFQRGQDKEAHMYHNLAEEFDKLAKVREDTYHKEYKDACGGAFDALEEHFGDIDLSEKESKKEA